MWGTATLQNGGAMSSAIDAIGAGSYVTATAASGGQTASPSRAEQLTELNQLLYTYQVGISRGESANMLGWLAKQITAAEKALGQHMSVRKPPPGSAETTRSRDRAQTGSATDTKHAVNATA